MERKIQEEMERMGGIHEIKEEGLQESTLNQEEVEKRNALDNPLLAESAKRPNRKHRKLMWLVLGGALFISVAVILLTPTLSSPTSTRWNCHVSYMLIIVTNNFYSSACTGNSTGLSPTQCKTWQEELYMAMNGQQWKGCNDSKLDPCSCDYIFESTTDRVVCKGSDIVQM